MNAIKSMFCWSVFLQNVSFANEISLRPSIVVDERIICDLRLIASGALKPLDGFMSKDNYNGVSNKISHLTNFLICSLKAAASSNLISEAAFFISNCRILICSFLGRP